jgi:hypothetical protein
MSRVIPAIFDSGVFRPLEAVELAQGTLAEVTPLIPESATLPSGPAESWPPGYFEQTAGALAAKEFERPSQVGGDRCSGHATRSQLSA